MGVGIIYKIMLKKFLIIVFHIIFISACSSTQKGNENQKFLEPQDALGFIGITQFSQANFNSIQQDFTFLIPEPSEFEYFNTYFQLGILHASKDLKNTAEIIFLSELNTSNLKTDSFIVGPFKPNLVEQFDNKGKNENLILMGLAQKNVFLPSNSISQINALKNYLMQTKNKKIMVAGKDASDNIKKLNLDLEYISLSNTDSNQVNEILGVSDSTNRIKQIDQASFSELKSIPRSRDDIEHVVLFPQEVDEIYEIASNIRFNYGLGYEISTLTYGLADSLDTNEIALHNILVFGLADKNNFGYDLRKARSYALGYDAMLLAYAKSNSFFGEVRGYNAIYNLTSTAINSKSYIN